MSELFSDEWMKGFQGAWNAEADLANALQAIGFNSNIGYGYKGEDKPRGVIVVENGHVTSAGAYNDETLNWDLRADADSWAKWVKDGIGMMGLGMAYTTGKIKFQIGDYTAMIKDPRMAGPFIKSFSVMGRVS